MLRYSSRPDLPAPILSALQDPAYAESLGDHFGQMPKPLQDRYRDRSLSVTTLIRAPRQTVLYKRHSGKLVLDPLAGFWKMFGHVIHSILESYPEPGTVVEERLGVEIKVGGRILYLHGQADSYNQARAELSDYKLVKAEAMLYGDKPENEAQLNVLGYIWRARGWPVRELRNIYLFRNWDARRVKEGSGYPAEQIQVVKVPLWSDEEIIKYISARGLAHLRALSTDDDKLPLCTEQERWARPPLHKVIKLDPKTGEPQKIAKFKSESMAEAKAYCIENNRDPKGSEVKFKIETLPAVSIKCQYCEVSAFCSQWRDDPSRTHPKDEDS